MNFLHFISIFLGYKLIEKIGEGTFSEVVKAKNKFSEFVAIKCIKTKVDMKDVCIFVNFATKLA